MHFAPRVLIASLMKLMEFSVSVPTIIFDGPCCITCLAFLGRSLLRQP